MGDWGVGGLGDGEVLGDRGIGGMVLVQSPIPPIHLVLVDWGLGDWGTGYYWGIRGCSSSNPPTPSSMWIGGLVDWVIGGLGDWGIGDWGIGGLGDWGIG